MELTNEMLENVKAFLNSPESVNHDLAFTILEGFLLTDEQFRNLIHFYDQKVVEEKSQQSLSKYLIGIPEDGVGVASKLLTHLLEHSDQQFIIDKFRRGNRLKLPRMESTEIPEIVFGQNQLEELIFREGNITHIPSMIHKLEKLRVLDLGFQPIERIDSAIGDLPNLKELYLRSALVIPDELRNKPKLQIVIEGAY